MSPKKQRIMPWPNTTYALFFCYLNPFTFINYCSKRNMLAFCVISQYSWWRHQMETFSALWPFVRGIHWAPVNSPHKGQWRVALMFFFICASINGWVNIGEAGDLRRHCAHFDVIVMFVRGWKYPGHQEPCYCLKNLCLSLCILRNYSISCHTNSGI